MSKILRDKRYVGLRVREVGSDDPIGHVIYKGTIPGKMYRSINRINLDIVTEEWTQFDDIEARKADNSELTFEEWTADGCQASYGCSQCKHYDECPDGQSYF